MYSAQRRSTLVLQILILLKLIHGSKTSPLKVSIHLVKLHDKNKLIYYINSTQLLHS